MLHAILSTTFWCSLHHKENRNGVAILTGDETEAELEALGADMLHYFGLGCRNVAQLFLPEGYDLNNIFGGLFPTRT